MRKGFQTAMEALMVLSLLVMVIAVFGNVVQRYLWGTGWVVSEELSRLLFVWLIFLGAILASVQRAHIGFDALVQRLPLAGRKLLVALTGGLMLWGCGMFMVGGWQQTEINLGNSYPVLGISYGWLYSVAIVFGAGMALAIANNIWQTLREPGRSQLTQDLGDRILEKMPEVASGHKSGEQQ